MTAHDTPPLRLVRADNPSPLTGTGTNSYIVGTGAVAVIDPGPNLPGHLAALLAALNPGEVISHIFVTHPHRDHSALARSLADHSGAQVLAFGRATDGRSPAMLRLMRDSAAAPGGGEGLDHAFQPDRRLADGEVVAGPDWSLTAHHTPGHLGSHLCFAAGDVLFSGDHVMGWSSSLISPPDGDMGDYMASLARLGRGRWRRFLPGHGEPVENPADRVDSLIRHRRMREAAILAALTDAPLHLTRLTHAVYTDTPAALIPAAERNVLAHLIDLHDRNMITATPRPGPTAVFARR